MSTGKPRWKYVLFDLDGTLIDSVDLVVASHQYAFKTVFSREVTREEMLPTIGVPLVGTIKKMAGDRAEEVLTAYRAYMDEHHDEIISAFTGMPELVADLAESGVKTAIVTSKIRKLAERGLRVTGYPQTIQIAAAEEDTVKHKPDPAPVLAGLANVGAEKAETVYVGDAIYDLRSAYGAGVPAIGVTWGAGNSEDLEKENALALVNGAEELRRLLFQ